MESSHPDLFIDMVVRSFIVKNNQIMLSPISPSYAKHVWDYLKKGLVFLWNSSLALFEEEG